MSNVTYINIGFTQKSHGLEGELKVVVEDRYLEDFMKNERIFVEVKGSKVPYFIENVRGKGAMILKLEDVEDKDAAFVLQSRKIFLREQDLIPEKEREFEVEEEEGMKYLFLVGFTMEDKTAGLIGVVTEVVEMPQQEMAFMKYKGKDVLIPLNEQLIVEVQKKEKKLLVDLPEGLLDM